MAAFLYANHSVPREQQHRLSKITLMYEYCAKINGYVNKRIVVERQLDGGLHLLLQADCLKAPLNHSSLWVHFGV